MRELTFRVSENEANALLAGLGKLPAEVSFDLIIKMKQQASEQMKSKEPEAETNGQDD